LKSDKITLDPHFFLNPEDFKLDKNPIGSGGSAVVYRGTYKEIDVAVKRLNISLQGASLEKALTEYKREVQTLINVRHPNLVLFLGVVKDPKNLCIVTEYCFGGSLFKLLHQDLHIDISWA